MDTIALADDLSQISGDDGFDHKRILRKRSARHLALCHVGNEKSTGLVAVQRPVSALTVRNFDGHAVAVGIRGNEYIGVYGLPQGFGQAKGPRILRIGIADGGEFRIGLGLLRDHDKIHKASLLHDAGERNGTGTVERCIDDGNRSVELLIRALCHGQNIVQIGPVHVLSEKGDESLLPCAVKGQTVNDGIVQKVQLLYLMKDAVRDAAGDLCAVLPINLAAVVLLRIVAGRHVDAGGGAQTPYGIGELRRGAKAGKQIDMNAVPCQNFGRKLREFPGMIPAVVGNNDASCGSAVREDAGGDALRCPADGPNVHPVGAGTADAAKPCGSKDYLLVKAIGDRVFLSGNGFQLPVQRVGRRKISKPCVIQLLNPFIHPSYLRFLCIPHLPNRVPYRR